MRRHDRSEYVKNFPRHPCPIPGCVNRDVDRAALCPIHAKRQARTGSALHHGLTLEQRRLAVQAIGRMIRHALKRRDLNTEMMVHELTQLIHDLPSGLPRLKEFRGRTPYVKAQAVLYHVTRQRWIDKCHPRTRTPQTERTWVIRLLALCMASELLAPSVCNSAQYVRTQVAQGIFGQLWPKEPKRYEVEDGRGGVTRTVIWNARPSSLQSRWIAQRLYELLSPCYLTWYRAHVDELKTRVPASTYTKTESTKTC